jgi:protein-disulfide isomerase
VYNDKHKINKLSFMSEENNTPVYNQTTVSDSAKLSLKDLMIPLSIIVAGLFVGGGLYFGGGSTAPVAAVPAPNVPQQAAEQADNTAKVAEITAEDHIKGSLEAEIMIVEYSDFDCPFCSRFHDSMNQVVANDAEVAWVFRQFPLEQLHPQAPAVAAASECVAELGGNDAFWSFTDGYFAARGAGDSTPHNVLIPQLATSAGVSESTFSECFESQRTVELVQDDLNNAVETGGRGTPWSILIGPTGKTYPINGALPASAVEQLIEVARQEA